MRKEVLIVHYNTSELTKAAVLSVWKHTPDARITVFDNSDRKKFVHMDGVNIIDNTEGAVLDFEKMIESFPNRKPSDNGYGSAKHCYTVDYCMDLFEDGFVLLDSDVLVKKDISCLFDENVMWVGEPHTTKKHPVKIPRIYPFCCFINTRKCRENGIRFFNPNYMWQLSDSEIGRWYDTGAWFYNATRGYPSRTILVNEYVVHFGGASFRKLTGNAPEEWLKKNLMYYG